MPPEEAADHPDAHRLVGAGRRRHLGRRKMIGHDAADQGAVTGLQFAIVEPLIAEMERLV